MQKLGILRQVSTSGVQAPLLEAIALTPGQEIVVGREPSCKVSLDPHLYAVVSRKHLVIRPQGKGWEVTDLGSANGTFVNGQPLQGSQLLQSGDRLTLGTHGPVFTFELQPYDHNNPASINSISSEIETTATHSSNPNPGVSIGPHSSLTLTQLFPLASTGKDLSRKAYLIPGMVMVIFIVLMFTAIGQPVLFNFLLGTLIALFAYIFIYQLCGKHKAWWILISAALMTAFMLVTPIIDAFIFVFRGILPGNVSDNMNLPRLFVGMFFGAGLMEEILKAIPIFVAMFLGAGLSVKKKDKVGVTEPLDGILLGAASAVGFTLIETLGQYVPNIINEVSLQVDSGTGELLGLQLLIPRVLGSVAGHMAYSGYFGYFIGLSILKPSKRWTILAIGCLTASLLHALWNTAGFFSSLLLAAVGVSSYAFLTAAILKARELSPTRADNFATRITK